MNIIFMAGGIVIGWVSCFIWYRKAIAEAAAIKKEGERLISQARLISKHHRKRRRSPRKEKEDGLCG
jgi:hypothetical protein